MHPSMTRLWGTSLARHLSAGIWRWLLILQRQVVWTVLPLRAIRYVCHLYVFRNVLKFQFCSVWNTQNCNFKIPLHLKMDLWCYVMCTCIKCSKNPTPVNPSSNQALRYLVIKVLYQNVVLIFMQWNAFVVHSIKVVSQRVCIKCLFIP